MNKKIPKPMKDKAIENHSHPVPNLHYSSSDQDHRMRFAFHKLRSDSLRWNVL